MTRMSINFFEQDKNVTELATGETVFEAGDVGEVMYGIQSGAVELLYHGQVIAKLGPGDIFGEMALADESPRSATAVAKTSCRLSLIDNGTFLIKIQHQPMFALLVIQTIAERLLGETARGR